MNENNSFNKLSKWMMYIACISLFIMMLLVTTEIILRIFDRSTLIADEYGGYLLAAAVFFGLAYSFKEESFTRVDIIYQKYAKKTVGFIWNKILLLINLFYIFLIGYFLCIFVKESYQLSAKAPTVSQTPLYIPQSVMVIGMFIFIVQLLVLIFTKGKN